MTEVFKPRENMTHSELTKRWECRDENGHLVCDGGPSVIWENGAWVFFITGIGGHRIDGPANDSGQWMINHQNITPEIHTFAKENNIDLDNLTDEDKVMIALKFG